MKLLISTGGKGERLYPLTKEIPKPMVLVCEKPVLHHLVDWAKLHNIKEIIMLNGYMANKIEEYFEDGSRFGVNIIHSNEPKPLGSGGPIKFAEKHVDSRFAYISGDVISAVDLRKMENFHINKNSHITTLAHKSSHAYDSDILDVDNNHKVIGFVSKHDDHTGAGDLTHAGLSIMEPEIFDLMQEEEFNFENYLFPKVLKSNLNFYSYITEEFIADVGTIDRLKKCEEYLRRNQALKQV